MEAAYVGLLVILLVLGVFSTPVAALPQRGLELMQTDSGDSSVWAEANDSLGTFWAEFSSLMERAERRPETSEEKP